MLMLGRHINLPADLEYGIPFQEACKETSEGTCCQEGISA